jgi:hypothetical protein
MERTSMTDDQYTWRTGTPPKPGWYNASLNNFPECWRWWNGNFWSKSAFDDESDEAALAAAAHPYTAKWPMFWRTYWPEGARVERV